ncbi:hypothetical protein [Paenibacillus lentus]|uniref:hypothetical protein n=1 Tax=Paenibacillus lentus TaxID=1338368 RepID=UPI001FED2905|nr:hypothetical protein [Paenibacillus lentus]
MALTGRPNKASEMIEDLADILSYSFSNPTKSVTWGGGNRQFNQLCQYSEETI